MEKSETANSNLYEISLSDVEEQSNINQTSNQLEAITLDDVENQNAELTEKKRIIDQIIELQNTLDDLSTRVGCVKEENLKLKSENEVLGKYIENLMHSSSVFQQPEDKNKNKN